MVLQIRLLIPPLQLSCVPKIFLKNPSALVFQQSQRNFCVNISVFEEFNYNVTLTSSNFITNGLTGLDISNQFCAHIDLT